MSGWQLDFLIAPFAYAPPLDEFVLALKYRGARRHGRALALLLAAEPHTLPVADALVPMPLHPDRLRERGYNQAMEIARVLARARGTPLLVRSLWRNRSTPPQAGASAEARRRNVAGAFSVSGALTGMKLVIVDDVVTTGATVNALAGALIRAGASSVGAWAVARTL